MAISKVTLNGQTLMDDTNNTATAQNMYKGVLAKSASGEQIIGKVPYWTEETVADDGAVTKELSPYIYYHFTGSITSLTIALASPSPEEMAHYHFDFVTGTTAPTFTLPNTVLMPESFSVKASSWHEISIINGRGAALVWEDPSITEN